jgi:hypothetical protein
METFKDVFIIHSKGESREDQLASRLIGWLDQLEISVYGYADWQWARWGRGKDRFDSSGLDLDPIRYAMGHPEPFRHRTWKQTPDRETLTEMLGNCRVVTVIAPRSGALSRGARVELEVLPVDPAVILASWGTEEGTFTKEHRHGYLYRIADIYDTEQVQTAVDLAHVVWFHWVLDFLARDGKRAGRALLLELARREPITRRSGGRGANSPGVAGDRCLLRRGTAAAPRAWG